MAPWLLMKDQLAEGKIIKIIAIIGWLLSSVGNCKTFMIYGNRNLTGMLFELSQGVNTSMEYSEYILKKNMRI